MPTIHPPGSYSDGASHTVTSAMGSLTVTSSTSVTIAAGGSATGDDADPYTLYAPALPGIFSQDSTIDLADGEIIGGEGLVIPAGSGSGLVQWGGSFTSSAGSCFAGLDLLNGAPGALVSRPSSFAVSGGTFAGGASPTGLGGTGLIVGLDGATAGTISGGSFSGGIGTAGPGNSLAYAGRDTSSLTISGAIYLGPISISLDDSSTLTITGTSLTYSPSTGLLYGTLSDGTGIELTIVCLNATPFTMSGSTSSLNFSP